MVDLLAALYKKNTTQMFRFCGSSTAKIFIILPGLNRLAVKAEEATILILEQITTWL